MLRQNTITCIHLPGWMVEEPKSPEEEQGSQEEQRAEGQESAGSKVYEKAMCAHTANPPHTKLHGLFRADSPCQMPLLSFTMHTLHLLKL